MAEYSLTPRARDGLYRIATYVALHFGPRIADEAVLEISGAFELLARNPEIGHQRQDLTDDGRVRFWPVGPSLIAYRNRKDRIEILFVERATRDWKQLLVHHLDVKKS